MNNKSLFDFGLDWKDRSNIKIEVPKDEVSEKLKSMTFETDYFINWIIFGEEENFTLSKTKVWFECNKKIVGKGKNQKIKFVLSIFQWWEKFKDIFSNEVECKNINELEAILENEKDNLKISKELFDKRIVFDGRRYWYKFDYINQKLYFIERVIPTLDEDSKIEVI